MPSETEPAFRPRKPYCWRRPGILGEVSVSVVLEADHTVAASRDQQIQVSVAIDIRKNGSSANIISADNASLEGNILELEATQILIELARSR